MGQRAADPRSELAPFRLSIVELRDRMGWWTTRYSGSRKLEQHMESADLCQGQTLLSYPNPILSRNVNELSEKLLHLPLDADPLTNVTGSSLAHTPPSTKFHVIQFHCGLVVSVAPGITLLPELAPR